MHGRIVLAVVVTLATSLIVALCMEPAFAEEISAEVVTTTGPIFYDPDPINAAVGDTVTWTNVDSQPHTVTSGSNGTPDGIFDSSPNFTPLIITGGTFSHTFAEAGNYPYYCALHPNMVGTVIVIAVPPPNGEQTPFSVTATVDGNSYEITGKSATSKATEATAQRGESVTVTFDKAGQVELTLPKALIEDIGEDDVIAGQTSLDFTQTEGPDSTTIKFTVPEDDLSVVIVPEFPVVAILLVAAISGMIAYTRLAKNRDRLF